MSTISVPLPADLEKKLNELVKQRGSNKAEVIRCALRRMAEEEAVQAVLAAQREVKEGKLLQGDIDELASTLED